MKKLVAASFVFVSAWFLIVGCESSKETFKTSPLSDYYPLKIGTTLTYRLDSTVPAPFGTALLVKSYQAKDSIESTFIDNQGRVSYRIFRLIRNLAGTQPWRFASTYVATPTQNTIEYVDNNLRFVKLVSPLKEEYTFNNASVQARTLAFNPSPIIVVEGIFVFYFREIADLLDLKIFIDAKNSIKLYGQF